MKIAYCIPGTYNSGGMERVLASKANYLAAQGVDVTIITTEQRWQEPFFQLSPNIEHFDLGINYEENNGKGLLIKLLQYPIKQYRHKRRLSKLLKTMQFDIVISMFGNEVSFVSSIKDRSRKVLEIHFSRFKRLQYGRTGLWRLIDVYRSRQDMRLVKKFDRFVVLTEEDRRYWGDLSNIVVIPNARTFTPAKTASLESHKALAIGRYDYQKGFEYLIDAWSIIHEKFPDWTLSIVGGGERKPQLQQQIAQLHLEDSIRLVQPTTAIEQMYLESSMYMMSSRYEGLPMVLLEAQAFGLPIVSFACKCGPRDVITDGKDGYLVPELDVPQLAERAMQLMADEVLRKQMGAAARQNSERFTQEMVMSKWQTLFNEVRKLP
jgi:glycosyltransferase involved in cell wall biosynthesis